MLFRYKNRIFDDSDYTELILKKDGTYFNIPSSFSRELKLYKWDVIEDVENLSNAFDDIRKEVKKQEDTARELVVKLFETKVDKSGLPYINHLEFVSKETELLKSSVIGLLHDTVEDTPFTLEMIRDMGFDDEIVKAVEKLTHNKDVDYLDYVKRLKVDIYAKDVKLADLKHNLDLKRLKNATEKMLKKQDLYKKALKILTE